jgi:hypothetical protein
VADGVLAKHWDVLQDDATEAELRSGLPILGPRFPIERSQSLSNWFSPLNPKDRPKW